MEFHLTATECHLPYGITQCYLPPDTSEHTPHEPQPYRPVLDLPTPEGWKAELTCLLVKCSYIIILKAKIHYTSFPVASP